MLEELMDEVSGKELCEDLVQNATRKSQKVPSVDSAEGSCGLVAADPDFLAGAIAKG